MNRGIKERWVAKLRSGEYPQTQNALKRTEPYVNNGRVTPPGYCCLGVLCDIAAENGVGTWVDSGLGYDGFVRSRQSAFLPIEVAQWAEIRHDVYGKYMDEDEAEADVIRELMSMNDRGVPFTEIADYVEEHL